MALKRGLGKGLDSLIPTNVMMESEVKHATVSTASSPEEEKDGTLMVKLSKVEPNREQPRKNFDEDSLQELAESLKQFGMLQPILVQNRGDYYEIIAGERRWRAAKIAGLKEVPVIIRKLDNEQAVIAMVDSNLQREKILPSEKAFAYKMRLEAMKHQGKVEKFIMDPVGPKWIDEQIDTSASQTEIEKNGKVNIKKAGSLKGNRSNEQLARMVGESVTQIKRYIRLTKLIPKILDMVDKEMLALRSAVELSFLTEDEQYQLYVIMEWEQAIPNLSQANRLKRMSQQQCLDIDKIYEILQEEKPNQREQIKLPMERIGKYFPENFTPSQQIALIEHLLKEWAETNRK